MKKVPSSLRTWFLIHSGVDMVFGLPLMFAPAWMMQFLGFTKYDSLTVRMLGAALIAIGVSSYWMHNAGIESFRAFLQLKMTWSFSAIFAIVLYMFELDSNQAISIFFYFFFGFFLVWSYYYYKIKN